MPNTNMTESEYRSLVSAIASATRELERFHSKNKTVESGLESLESTIKSTVGILAGMEGKIKAFSDQMNSGMGKLNSYQQGIKDLSRAAKDSGSAQATLGEKIGSALDKYKDVQVKINTVKDAFGDMKGVIEMIAPALQKQSSGAAQAIGEIGISAAAASGANGLGSLLSLIPKFSKFSGVAAVGGTMVGILADEMERTWDQMVREDLAGRFGSIALSADEIAAAVGRIATNPEVERAGYVLERVAEAEEKFNSLKNAVRGIDANTYSVYFGVEMSEADFESAAEEIEEFISHGRDILKENRLTVSLEMKGLDDDISAKIVGGASKLESEFAQKGEELRKAFNNALADGVIDSDERQVIEKLKKEMTEILDSVTTSRYEVQMRDISFQGELTPESYSEFIAQMDAQISEAVKQLEKEKEEAKEQIKKSFDSRLIDASEKQRQIKLLEQRFQNERMELVLPSIEVKTDQLNASFQTQMDQIGRYYQSGFGNWLKDYADAYGTGMDSFSSWSAGEMASALDSARSAIQDEMQYDISPEARENAKLYYDQLKPTKEMLEEIVAECRQAGQSVPQSVLQGLSDINTIGAIADQQDSIWYLMGSKYGDDPMFQEMLQKATDGGAQVNEYLTMGVYSNGNLVTEAMQQAFAVLRNTAISTIDEITPEMLEALTQLGFDTSQSFTSNFAEGLDSNIQVIRDSAAGTITEFKNTVTGNVIQATPEMVELMARLGYDMNSSMGTTLKEKDLVSPKVNTPDSGEPMMNFIHRSQNLLNSHSLTATMNIKTKLEDDINNNVPMANALHDYNINISRRAVGGVFRSPQIIEVGEAGPEAVVPLKDNAPWIAGLAQSVSARIWLDAWSGLFRQLEAQAYMAGRQRTETGTDYDLLASRLAEELRRSPITVSADLKNNVDVKVNMDGEAVGRATAPTISRILARRGG